jgi:hypothetical protein
VIHEKSSFGNDSDKSGLYPVFFFRSPLGVKQSNGTPGTTFKTISATDALRRINNGELIERDGSFRTELQTDATGHAPVTVRHRNEARMDGTPFRFLYASFK